MQLTLFSLAKALSELVAPSAVFDPSKVFLGVASAIANNGVNTTLADVTPATGSVAPLQEVTTFSAPYLTKTGLEVVDSGVLKFTPSTVADAQTVANWYLCDALTAGNLLGFGTLNPAVPLLGPQSVLSFVLRLTLDPAGTWDASVQWDD